MRVTRPIWQRALGIDGLAHQQHFHAPAAANDPRQPRGGAAARDDAELAFRGGKRAWGAAIRRSQPRATSRPPPMQMPLMAAMVGFGVRSS